MHLTDKVKTIRVENAAAAGTTDVESDVVDMGQSPGFNSVRFIVLFGTITANAVTSVKAQQGDLLAGSDMDDLEDSAVTVADDDDNQIVIVDVVRPAKQYVRCVVDRGTQNAVIDGIIAELYDARDVPVDPDTTTLVGSTKLVTPDEGTA